MRPLLKAAGAAIVLFVASTYVPRDSMVVTLLVKALFVAALVALIARPGDWARARAMARDAQPRWASKGAGAA
jgi:hypothetical protein